MRYEFRRQRVRRRLQGAGALPRLSVHRSLRYFYAQIIDDIKGRTLVSASSSSLGKGNRKSCKNMEDAKAVGRAIAQSALKAGIQKVVFDRGGRLYHGRIKVLAEAAREAGLQF
jgi:large subunit ribosomal protein L18